MFASILIGGMPFALFMSLLMYLGTKELVNMMNAKDFRPSVPVIFSVQVVLVVLAYLGLTEYFPVAITLGTIATFLTILSRKEKATIAAVATTITIFMYGGWLPIHLLLTRNLETSGLDYIILIFFIVTISDIAGFYIGTRFGKTPLTVVSPKKTLEGAIGSTVGGILVSVLVGHFIGLTIVQSLIAGLLLVLAAQFGDLAESMLKRDSELKDSGNILPGHGGILDRADSYIFTGAVAYYYFTFFVG